MKKNREFNIFSLLWTLLVHACVIGLLLVLHMTRPLAQAESGVPVMLGNMGNLDTDYEFTEVNSMPEEKPVKPVETPRQPTPEEIRAEQERQVQEQANSQMTDAFSRSRNMQASSTTETNSNEQGSVGSENGNASQGKSSGEPNYGTFDLGGRGMIGLLPRPAYEGIQEEGRVQVVITVSPEGDVINTSINLNRTSTTNPDLRRIALEAARKAKFEPTPGLNNQSGTITYYFKLK